MIVNRPEEPLISRTFKWKTQPENTYVILSEHEGRLVECFIVVGKGGQTVHGLAEALGRVISIALRAEVDLDKLIDQLKNIGGADAVWQDGVMLFSIPHCAALSIEHWRNEHEISNTDKEVHTLD